MSRDNPIGDFYPSMEATLSQVREFWEFKAGFPCLRKWPPGRRDQAAGCAARDEPIHCPTCGSWKWCISQWQFLERDPRAGEEGRPLMTRFPYRCNVLMKCTVCSATWPHGVVVPPEEEGKRLGVFRRKQALAIIEAES